MQMPYEVYEESLEQTAARGAAFTHHPPDDKQVVRYAELRRRANELACVMNRACPRSRELSLALTHLQESVMWANAAIACNEVKLKR